MHPNNNRKYLFYNLLGGLHLTRNLKVLFLLAYHFYKRNTVQVTRNLIDVVWWQFRALNHTNVCNDFATWCGKIFSGSITLEFCKFTNFKALLPAVSIDILSVILIKLSKKKKQWKGLLGLAFKLLWLYHHFVVLTELASFPTASLQFCFQRCNIRIAHLNTHLLYKLNASSASSWFILAP